MAAGGTGARRDRGRGLLLEGRAVRGAGAVPPRSSPCPATAASGKGRPGRFWGETFCILIYVPIGVSYSLIKKHFDFHDIIFFFLVDCPRCSSLQINFHVEHRSPSFFLSFAFPCFCLSSNADLLSLHLHSPSFLPMSLHISAKSSSAPLTFCCCICSGLSLDFLMLCDSS